MLDKRCENQYAKLSYEGRAHISKHHYVAERFFGRSKNRSTNKRTNFMEGEFKDHERKIGFFCYECHEVLLHNPVLLPEDIGLLKKIYKIKGLQEDVKTESYEKLKKKIIVLKEVISLGLKKYLEDLE